MYLSIIIITTDQNKHHHSQSAPTINNPVSQVNTIANPRATKKLAGVSFVPFAKCPRQKHSNSPPNLNNYPTRQESESQQTLYWSHKQIPKYLETSLEPRSLRQFDLHLWELCLGSATADKLQLCAPDWCGYRFNLTEFTHCTVLILDERKIARKSSNAIARKYWINKGRVIFRLFARSLLSTVKWSRITLLAKKRHN